MFKNNNNGYCGFSRSVRSAQAIENFEVPLSLINKGLIKEFLDYTEEFTEEEKTYLEKISVAKWKFAAELSGASSWHHTSNYYNKTNHYSLEDTAEKIIELKEILDALYNTRLEDKKRKEEEKNNYKYGVIEAQDWGGSRSRPQLLGTEKYSGIVINGWLYYLKRDKVYKFKTNANKVVYFKAYNSYAELVKKHKEYKNTKKYLMI